VAMAGGVFVTAVWRSAKNLQGHAVAGAEVIAAALARVTTESGPRQGPDALDRMRAMLPGLGEPVAMRVEPGCAAANRTLGELDLRGITGATVLAVLRGDQKVVSPRGEMQLREGDVLAVAGTHAAIDQVRDVVTTPPPPGA